MNEPLPVIPLEYDSSQPVLRWRWQHAALKGLILGSYIFAVAAWILIWLVDVETVMATGPILGLTGLIMTIFSIMVMHYPSLFTAIGHITICGLFWSLVLTFEWTPARADGPFKIIGGLYLIISFGLSTWTYIQLQKIHAATRK